MFKNIINRLVTNWKNIFSKNLSTLQREKATEYLFWELERLCNQDKITKEDYEFTQNRGNVHNDADAIYIMMQKNKLITVELLENLKKIKALKYFENLKLENFVIPNDVLLTSFNFVEMKNYENLRNKTLDLLWDINGHKKENEVIDCLVTEVFSKINKENFTVISDEIRRAITNNPKNEIEIFEKAIKYFGEKNEQK